VLQDYIHAVEDAEARLASLERQIEALLPRWSMAPVVEGVQAMRGVGLIVAVTVVAEVGDFSRFANPRQLMAYLGLVPSEHSSGSSIRRGGSQGGRLGPLRPHRARHPGPHPQRPKRQSPRRGFPARPWSDSAARRGRAG
jgi:transposase